MSAWGIAPGIRLSRKPSAEGALQFRAGGSQSYSEMTAGLNRAFTAGVL